MVWCANPRILSAARKPPHIAQNQPSVDGNKRTAILAAIVFLDLNGVEIPEATEELYDAMIGIAERRLGKEDVAAVLRRLGASG